MKKFLLALLPCVLVLSGCGENIPNCANEETTKLVESIYWDTVGKTLAEVRKGNSAVRSVTPQDVESLKKLVSIKFSTIEQTENKNKDKFSCKARMSITPSAEGMPLMLFAEKDADAAEQALLVILIGAGKDYTDPQNRTNKNIQFFDSAAKAVLGSPRVAELVQKESSQSGSATGAFIQNFAKAAINATVGAYATQEIGPQNLEFLAATINDISTINTKDGVYTADIKYTSEGKKIDNQSRHFVEAKFNESEVILPLDLFIVGNKFNRGNEIINRYAKQVSENKK